MMNSTIAPPVLGVIIPVGRSELHIAEFMKSYCEAIKSYPGIVRSIVVCNNSTTECVEILGKFASQNCVVYNLGIHPCGISAARNFALSRLPCDVEFVCFLDDDDCLNGEALRRVPEHFSREIDILYFGFMRRRSAMDKFIYVGLPRYQVTSSSVSISNDLPLYLKLPREMEYMGYCWAKFYRRNMIDSHELRFSENISSFEDVLFLINAMLVANQVAYVDMPLVFQNAILRPIDSRASLAGYVLERAVGFLNVARFIRAKVAFRSASISELDAAVVRYVGYLFYFAVLRCFSATRLLDSIGFFFRAKAVLRNMNLEFEASNYFVNRKSGESVIVGTLHRLGLETLAILACMCVAKRRRFRKMREPS